MLEPSAFIQCPFSDNIVSSPSHPPKYRLDGVLASPLPCRRFVPGAIGLVDVCNFGNEGIVRVWICEHGTD